MIWEDETPDSDRWWAARAKDVTPGGRFDYFLVEDAVTTTYVGVVLAPRSRRYRVIAVADSAAGVDAAVAQLKSAVSLVRAGFGTALGAILAWRLRRNARMVLRDLPLAAAAFAGGAALGLAVSYVAVSSRVAGWPMVLAGLVLGASAGPAFKFLVDRRPSSVPVRPWARFAVVILSAGFGAAAGVGTMLTLSWN